MSCSLGRSIIVLSRAADPVGAGLEVETAATVLRDAGHDVHVGFTSAGGTLPSRLAAKRLCVHHLGRRPNPDVAATGRLAMLIGRLRPATVLAWGRSQTLLAAAAMRIPPSMAPRPRLVSRISLAPRRTLDVWALTRADYVLAASSAVAKACEMIGVSARQVETSAPMAGLAASEGLSREAIGSRLDLDPKRAWSLCVAPLVASSRLDRLLWAIDQLGVVRRDIEHVLIGSGPQASRLFRRARVQELADRLRIVPFCDCLPDLLRHVRFVWQSGEVSLGGALFDAMAASVPTVAVESDAARQAIVDGETGWIVPPLPESDLPRRALSLIEDDATAARFRTAARERAAALFPVERFVARLLAAVMEEKPSQPPLA